MIIAEAEARAAELLRRPGVARLLAVLEAGGEQARLVGGSVRNALLGEPVGDIDIATTVLPEETLRRCKAAGWKTVPTGLAHGTVTILIGGAAFEVTTLRADVETDGRRARVAFGRDWRTDALRRDFTINALTLDSGGRLHDPVDGIDDIAARRVRFIGDPHARIREDFLRILRFFRFHAAYGQGEPDAAGLAAAIAERAGLARLSAERIRQELLKLVAAPGAVGAARAMAECGILQSITGGVPWVARFRNLVRLEGGFGHAADPLLRLAALAVFVAEDAERLRRRLRLSNREAERLAAAAGPRVEAVAGPMALRTALYRLGAETYRDRLLLGAARSPSAGDGLAAALELPDRWPVPVLPVSGARLAERGLAPGPAIGAALRAVEARWIAAGFPQTQALVDAIVDAVLAEQA